jgi:GNAT superfamily N-acetyltransferase
MSTFKPFSLSYVIPDDIDALAQISADAFLDDRQTQMKALGRAPYNMGEQMKVGLKQQLSSDRYVCIKAVEQTSGEPMGWVCWAFRGFEEGKLSKLKSRLLGADVDNAVKSQSNSSPNDASSTPNEGAKSVQTQTEATAEMNNDSPGDDSIKRLEVMTNQDMQKWMKILMPEGAKCMIVVGCSVATKFQSLGVGSALLNWGTEVADEAGVYIWVHSSDNRPAVRAYQKHGFEVVGTLDVDLDEYSPAPPPGEGEGQLWGHYVFRYMKRLPR